MQIKSITNFLLGTFVFLLFSGCDDGKKNRPPEFENSPGDNVKLYDIFEFVPDCQDPDGDELEVFVGDNDSCGGQISDGLYFFKAQEALAGLTCLMSIVCSDSKHDNVLAHEIEILPPRDIEELSFQLAQPWATPIEDYITAGASELGNMNFNQAISDLQVFDGNFYLGYGDATYNLGRVSAIEPRYFTSLDASSLRADFAVEEEEISFYRVYEDLLLIPGVDATEDGLMGNVYLLEKGGNWYKSRTLEFAWHVHDVAVWGNKIYACGSGGNMDDYNNSTVNAFLWVSHDGGENFEIAQQLIHPQPPGDHRFTSLAVHKEKLYIFGYYSSEGTTYGLSYIWDGQELSEYNQASDFFVLDTYPLSSTLTLLNGVNIGSELTWGVRLLENDQLTPVDALSEYTVLDLYCFDVDRCLVLYLQGNSYPLPTNSSWVLKLGLLQGDGTLNQFENLLSQTVPKMPVSIGWWKQNIFIGMKDGTILRSIPNR
ncbi:MAG: hypothetical protein PF689_02985 [Deltaproteobacteria bacterium]|jgi:hypothetical protein|nr:hypothetical protein [Deltaproteobacteria bacterium]